MATSGVSSRHNTAASTARSALFPFQHVIISFPDQGAAETADAYPLNELRAQYEYGNPGTGDNAFCRIHATTDPYGARVGSGGGTLAAISQVLHSYPKMKKEPSIVILHAGGESSRCPSQMVLGKAWTSIPTRTSHYQLSNQTTTSNTQFDVTDEGSENDPHKVNGGVDRSLSTVTTSTMIQTPIHMWMDLLCTNPLFRSLPEGCILVVASDTLIQLSDNRITKLNGGVLGQQFYRGCDQAVVGLAVPAVLETAKNHGVYVLNDGDNPNATTTFSTEDDDQRIPMVSENRLPVVSTCRRVFQKPSMDVLRSECQFALTSSDGPSNDSDADISQPREQQQVAWIDTGVVIFFPVAARQLRQLASETSDLMATVSPHSESLSLASVCTKEGLYKKHQQHSTMGKRNVDLLDFVQQTAVKVDLYTHMLQALQTSADSNILTLQDYRHRFPELPASIAASLFETLHQFELRILAVPQGRFLHLGTTRELCDFLIQGCRHQDEDRLLLRYESNSSSDSNEETDESFAPPLNRKIIRKSSSTLSRRRRRLDLCRHFGHDMQVVRRHSSVVRTTQGVHRVHRTAILCESILGVTQDDGDETDDSVLTVGSNTILEHCCYQTATRIEIGKDCLLSGLRSVARDDVLRIPNGIMIQQVALPGPRFLETERVESENGNVSQTGHIDSTSFVYMVLGVDDSIKQSSILYGLSLESFLLWAEIDESDLWKKGEDRSLWTAKLHPVVPASKSFSDVFLWLCDFLSGARSEDTTVTSLIKQSLDSWKRSRRLSLSEIRDLADAGAEFEYRRELRRDKIPNLKLELWQEARDILLERQLRSVDFAFVFDAFSATYDLSEVWSTLRILDDAFLSALAKRNYDVCGRSCMAASSFLDRISEVMPRIDEDPRTDLDFASLVEPILSMNENDVQRMTASYERFVDARNQQLSSSFLAPFTVKHCTQVMELIAASMTRRCVLGSDPEISLSLQQDLTLHSPQHPTMDQWILSAAPARVDLAGGWTDTPPICFEYGSAVTGIAVLVDGMFPLSCRCRIVSGSSHVFLRTENRELGSGKLLSAVETRVEDVTDLSNYNVPNADCALLKCVLVFLGLENRQSGQSFQWMVNNFCKSDVDVGLELVATSLLPQGSGLGTSSILAGCVLASVAKCTGLEAEKLTRYCDNGSHDLMEAVLKVEQLLTTGGGYQDQMNGLVGGAKMVTCATAQFPIHLQTERLHMEHSFQECFNESLTLVFTGKTRLAKNILRNVLRRWALRTPTIKKTVAGLVKGAQDSRQAILNSDLDRVGRSLSEYWEYKKSMAGEESGAEPLIVREVLAALHRRGVVRGGSLCGAGGGGFMVLLKAAGVTTDHLRKVLAEELPEELEVSNFTWHDCKISDAGLSTRVLSSDAPGHFDITWHSV